MKKRRGWLLLLLASAAVASACADTADEGGNQDQLNIVTSFYPVYEFTQQVVGERADVSLMVGSGADPHTYEPSARDVTAVSNADMFVFSSEDMEFWAESLLNTVENDELTVVRLADGLESADHYETPAAGERLDTSDLDPVSEAPENVTVIGVAGHYHSGDTVTLRAQNEEAENWEWHVKEPSGSWELMSELTDDRFEKVADGEDFFVQAVALDAAGDPLGQSEIAHIHIDDHEGEDPHIWLDPVLAQDQVRMIEEALVEIDPEHEAYYSENAERFIAELQDLHEDFESTFAEAENRTFVVQHKAFGYIAARYNLEQVAIGGLSTEVEPSPSRIAEINRIVEDTGVPVIFYQQGADSSIAQTVANETGTETAVLHDLETLSEELQANDLGYIEAMRENLEALQQSIY